MRGGGVAPELVAGVGLGSFKGVALNTALTQQTGPALLAAEGAGAAQECHAESTPKHAPLEGGKMKRFDGLNLHSKPYASKRTEAFRQFDPAHWKGLQHSAGRRGSAGRKKLMGLWTANAQRRSTASIWEFSKGSQAAAQNLQWFLVKPWATEAEKSVWWQ
jgi:hypothetical protein